MRFYQLSRGVVLNCPYVDNSYKWAGGGFLSTAEDLIRFGQAHLNNEFVSQSTFDEFVSTQKTSDGKATGYGMGWLSASDSNGNHWVGHGGGSVGGISMLRIYPEHGLVVIVLTNMSQASIGNLTTEIANAFIDK